MPAAVRRHVSLLALVAMLLLALLPTVGRLAGAVMPPGCEMSPSPATVMSMDMSSMDMARMTTEEHRAHMAAMAALAHPAAPKPAPAGRHGDHDCPYCPLLAGLATSEALPWHPHAPPALGPWSVRAVVARAMDAPVPALGAQGPPPLAG